MENQEQKTEVYSSKFKYHGKGSDLFKLFFKTFFLSIITLGIYSFWGRVQITKYIYKNVEFAGARFEFHGTGEERFIGFLKVFGFSLALILVIAFIYLGLEKITTKEVASQISVFIVYGVIIAVLPLAIVSAMKYRLSRTSYRGQRFSFHGDIIEFAKIFLKGVFLSFITLGIYSFWFRCEMNRYFAQKSNFSNYTFDFKGKGDELFVLTLKGVFFTFLTCGIYLAWFLASYYNYMMNNTSFNGQKFKQKLDGGDFFANLIIAYLLIFFTLFIGIPWAMNRLLAFRINAVSYEGEIRIVKEDVDTSTGAEGEQFLDDAGGGFLPI